MVYMRVSATYVWMESQAYPAQQTRESSSMRAEAEALVETIKQSMGLLRRHL